MDEIMRKLKNRMACGSAVLSVLAVLVVFNPVYSAQAGSGPTAVDKPADAESNQKAPEAYFHSLRHNFEPVMEGETITHDFIVENTGSAPLVIKKISPD